MSLPLPEDWPTPQHDVPRAQLLERAFVLHSGLVARIAFKLLRRPDEVNDVVQDVFVAALQAGPRLSLRSSMAGWLAIVTVRSAAKRIRRRRLGHALGLDTGLSYDQVAAPGADAEAQVSASRLVAAISDLPEELRHAWVLRHVDGEPLEDVAKLCACSLSTAKRRINAAHARLRRIICDGSELQ